MRCRASLQLALMLGVAGCGDPSDPGDVTQGFRVTTMEPTDGATDVPIHSRLRAGFSADLDSESHTPSDIILTRDGASVPLFLSFPPSARQVEAAPPLVPGTTYRATVGRWVRSSTGDTLVGQRAWTFTTRQWESAFVPSIGKLGVRDAEFDPAGGAHLVGEGEFYLRPGNDMGDTYVKYVSCTAPCATSGNWSRVALDSAWLPGLGMGIELDDAGVLHLIHLSSSPAPAPDFGPPVIRYLTCPTDCSSPSSWTGATVDSTPDFAAAGMFAGFAVGPAGAVHLLTLPAAGGLPELRYGACDGSCINPENWTFTPIPVAGYTIGPNPLQVDNAGGLHLVTSFDNVLTYSTCSAGCTAPAQWTSAPVVTEEHAVAGYSYARDVFARIHVVYSDSEGNLKYTICEESCTGGGWSSPIRIDTGDYPGSSLGVDLTGRVTVLNPVNATAELHYLTCINVCDSAGNWQSTVVEHPAIFDSPQPGPPNLTSNPDGSLRMVYSTTGHDLFHLQ